MLDDYEGLFTMICEIHNNMAANNTIMLSTAKKETKESENSLLPSKSRFVYEREFEAFNTWRKTRGVVGIDEKVVLAYFAGKAKTGKALETNKNSISFFRCLRCCEMYFCISSCF